ncbi:MAG: glycosyl hydrolase 115 family protein [Sedimentisphaerales bacterium]|nr:glycosyl hydrolase 115 family protein [Sedimentisphaerales bacterium]
MGKLAPSSQKSQKIIITQIHKMSKGTLLILFLSGLITVTQTVKAIDFESYISEQSKTGAFTLSAGGKAAPLYISSHDWPGVIRALGDLQGDIKKVTGAEPSLSKDAVPKEKEVVLVGTLGKSPVIDQLVKDKKIDVSGVTGQWETFIVQVVEKPLEGVDRALVIAGSDKRGTIYGIYDLTEDIGISPLHFWGDSQPKKKEALYVLPGRNKQGPPSVRYRGIFINDEAPDLSNWVRMKYGTIPQSSDPPVPSGVANYGSEFYKTVFEMILRMKGNYLWPAMWNNAFNEDDPLNPKLADEYGIVMGTSHQEPMIRAQKEWDRRYQRTLGSWNYYTHPEELQSFWRDGITRNKDYESILTIGLRGANDTEMIRGGTVEESMALLEKIVAVQRDMITDVYKTDITKVPQSWCLYKEVQEYYTRGLRVPDDVTLLWAEDNWHNVRRLPTEAERNRSGGAGIYYHFDYHGGPRDYMWINTISFPQVWEQMTLAKEYGADRIWIVNVGHLKHVIFPMEYFINLGWNTKQWTNDNIRDYIEMWAEREFGSAFAKEIAEIYVQYSRFNARRKPELLDTSVYSQTNYREAEKVVDEFNALAAKAEEIYNKLPQEMKDAFYDLILFPTKISANYTELYLTAGKNALYAQQGRASANDLADKVSKLFQNDSDLINFYHTEFADGRWNHFMDQVHIGYTTWNAPGRNSMPRVSRLELPAEASLGVAVEGSEQAWPGAEELSLPQFDVFNQQKQYIDVFNRGRNSLGFAATASEPWILLSTNGGTTSKDFRIFVSIDWAKAPKGKASGTIKIFQTKAMMPGDSPSKEFSFQLKGTESATVKIEAFNPTEVARDNLDGFVEGQGVVSIEAEHFTRNVPAGNVRWEKIEDYGRTLSGLSIMPVTAKSVTPPKNSPCLEYKMYIFNPGEVKFYGIVGPSLNFDPTRGTHIAVSIDGQEPKVIEILPQSFNAVNGNRTWENAVRNYCHVAQATLNIEGAGYHTLKIWMVDPGIVVQKFVLDLGGWKPSYLGPTESFRK